MSVKCNRLRPDMKCPGYKLATNYQEQV